MDALLVFCTCPGREIADRVAAALVAERLAACVNILPGVVSMYRWLGEVHCDEEVLLLIKTTGNRFAALEERLLALHPDDVPEVIALPIVRGHAPYLDWLCDVVDARANEARSKRS